MKEKLELKIEITAGHGILAPHRLEGDAENATVIINDYYHVSTEVTRFSLKRQRIQELSDMLLRYLKQTASFDEIRANKDLLEPTPKNTLIH